LYKHERKRPTPVRRRLSRTQALLGRVTPGGGWRCWGWECGVLWACPPTPHSIGDPPTAPHVCCCWCVKETRGMAQLGMFLSVYFPATFPFLLHSSDQNLHFVRCLLFRATAGGLRPPRILSVALTLHATTPHPIWLTHRIPTGILIMVRFGLTSVNQVSWRRVLVACLKRGYLVFFRRLSCVVSRGYLVLFHEVILCCFTRLSCVVS